MLPSGLESRVARLVTLNGDRPRAVAGESVTLTLQDDIDIGRGDMLAAADAAPEVADQFECTLVWMADAPMLPGRSFFLKIGARTVVATVTELKYRLDVSTQAQLAARRLDLNDIGVCNLALYQAVAFDPYASDRDTGGLILIDRVSFDTVAAGMLHFALRRAARAAIKGHKPTVLWFTGLSGAGKSTLANLVEKRLHAMGRHTAMLDGDNHAPWSEPRPGFSGRRPGGKRAPRGRGGALDGRCRPGGSGGADLAISRRTCLCAQPVARRRVHRGLRRCAFVGG